MRYAIIAGFLLSSAVIYAAFFRKKPAPLATVSHVDVSRYVGVWYEIGRLPNAPEKNLKCITATYAVKPDGNLSVLNGGFNLKKNKYQSIEGFAKITDTATNAKLKVSFFRPFYGDLWILDLDSANYTYAMVGSPSRGGLWLLSRTPMMTDTLKAQLLQKAQGLGFDLAPMIWVDQSCE